MRNTICNFSEIAPVKRVLLHRPGDEFLNLTPNTLERLLFDDIPYLKVAQQEHDAYANALRAEGVEVVYVTDLVAGAIEAGGRTVRKKALSPMNRYRTRSIPNRKLFSATITLILMKTMNRVTISMSTAENRRILTKTAIPETKTVSMIITTIITTGMPTDRNNMTGISTITAIITIMDIDYQLINNCLYQRICEMCRK